MLWIFLFCKYSCVWVSVRPISYYFGLGAHPLLVYFGYASIRWTWFTWWNPNFSTYKLGFGFWLATGGDTPRRDLGCQASQEFEKVCSLRARLHFADFRASCTSSIWKYYSGLPAAEQSCVSRIASLQFASVRSSRKGNGFMIQGVLGLHQRQHWASTWT
jgi:hypothetical protein